MATYDLISDLPLVVERVGYQPHVLEMPRFTRVAPAGRRVRGREGESPSRPIDWIVRS